MHKKWGCLVFILLYVGMCEDELGDLILTGQTTLDLDYAPEILFDENYATLNEDSLFFDEPESEHNEVMLQVESLLQDENPLIEQMLQLAQGVGDDGDDTKIILQLDDPMDQSPLEASEVVDEPQQPDSQSDEIQLQVILLQISDDQSEQIPNVELLEESPTTHFIDENVPEYAVLQSPQSESKIVYEQQYKGPKVIIEEEKKDAELVEDSEQPNWMAQTEFMVGAIMVFISITLLWQTEMRHLRQQKIRRTLDKFIHQGAVTFIKGEIDTTHISDMVEGYSSVYLRVLESNDPNLFPEQILQFPVDSVDGGKTLHKTQLTLLGRYHKESQMLIPLDLHLLKYEHSMDEETSYQQTMCDEELCYTVQKWQQWGEWKNGEFIFECVRGIQSRETMVGQLIQINSCSLNLYRLSVFCVMCLGVQLFFIPIYQVLQLFPIFGGLLDYLGVYIGFPVGFLFATVFCLSTTGVTYCLFKPRLGALLICLAVSVCTGLVACTHYNIQLTPESFGFLENRGTV